MFADDTKLYCAIKSKDDRDIQQDLDNIPDWGRIWLTNFNSHICKVLSLGIATGFHSKHLFNLIS